MLPLLAMLQGCALWHDVGTKDLSSYLETEKPGAVRVSLADSTLVLTRPLLHRDSLLGVVRESRPPQYAAVPVSEIRKVEARSFQGSPSAKVAAGVLGVIVAAAIVGVALSGPSRTNP